MDNKTNILKDRLDKIEFSKWLEESPGEYINYNISSILHKSQIKLLDTKDEPPNLLSSFKEQHLEEARILKRDTVEIGQNKFITGENWLERKTFEALISDIQEDIVICDCLISTKEFFFQKRVFNKILFENIPNLSINKPVLIKLKTKVGATRIDVLDGEGIVNLNLFKSKSDIKTLTQRNISSPLDHEINF